MPILLSFFLWISNQAKISIDFISSGALFPIVTNLWVWQSMFQITLVIISTSVFVYCWFYMEPTEYTRFSITILVFIMAMMIFICHESLLMLLTGWDGLGASSFLLVIHYWSWGSLSGGLTTLLTNRVGDICIFMFFGACVVSSASDDFSVLQTMAPQVFLIMSGCTKSAQVPFSSWLPLAMSAPTPVSSLVHSSTLVTAGVYLFLRYFNSLTDSVLCYLLVVGLATSIVGGFGALVEPDTKKVIAMSTLSQLGFLTLALGASLPMLSFTHLLTHAMLKSCLFLQVGTAIHAMSSSQNSQLWVGNSALSQSHPILVGGSLLSMCGMGFLSGFMSKDAVLGGVYTSSMSLLLVVIVMASIGLTIAYSIKIWWDLYVTGSMRCVSSMDTTHTIVPSIPLFIGGVAFGWVIQWNYLPVTITGLQEEKGLPLLIPPLVALLLIINLNISKILWTSIPISMFGLDSATRESSFMIHKTMTHHELTVSPASYLNLTKSISFIMKEPVWVGVPFVFSLLCLIALVSL